MSRRPARSSTRSRPPAARRWARPRPSDAAIGSMLAVVERFGAERVCLALASEARRKRRRPIKSWRLSAEIACESLAEEPRAPPPAPGEMAALLNGESVPRAALMAAIERWNAGGDWPTSLGGPPRRHGCALPETFLAMCAEVCKARAAFHRFRWRKKDGR